MRDLAEHVVRLAGRELRLLRPRDPETLLDEEAFADEEFIPYWAELWPSAHALVAAIGSRDLRGTRVLELGCGLGLPSLAAALGGAEVVATDWAPDAVELLAENARRNGIELRAVTWRWTDPPERLGPPWPLVVASDVLYERRNEPWLRTALEGVLVPGGEAWIADPGRATASGFLDGAEPLPGAPGVHRMLSLRTGSAWSGRA